MSLSFIHNFQLSLCPSDWTRIAATLIFLHAYSSEDSGMERQTDMMGHHHKEETGILHRLQMTRGELYLQLWVFVMAKSESSN